MRDKNMIGPEKELVTICSFKDVEDVEVSWLWEPFIPFGDVTIVEGDGMAGKTTAMIRLACIVSQGIAPPPIVRGELGESKAIEPLHVLYVGIEANNETEIKPCILYSNGDLDYLHFVDQSEQSFVLTESYVREAIKKSRCRLMIVDPYTNFLPAGISLGNAVSMRQFLTKLMRIAREMNVAIVLVGHLSKAVYGKAIYQGYGSADIINTVRSVLLVARDENGIRYLRILKSNYFGVDAYFRIGLQMDDNNCIHFEDYNYLVAQQETDDVEETDVEHKEKLTRTNQCVAEITELLLGGPVKRAEVYEAVAIKGYPDRTISRAFSRMCGISYYVGRTVYWKLPEKEENA